MSALAEICLAKGDAVTGSDLRPNNLTDKLAASGAVIFKGHAESNVPRDAGLAVRSSCIRDDNPEVRRAGELEIPVISRGEMLRRVISAAPFSMAATGTHGKTTTSALLAHIAQECGKEPTVLIGGEMENFKGNARFGKGGTVVAEVDESDGYFRNISVTCAVITNIEKDHMENYGSFDDLIAAYSDFIRKIPKEGVFVFNGEDPVLERFSNATPAKKITFGIDRAADVTCRGHKYDRSIEFELIIKGEPRGMVESRLIGRHNLMNILGAVAACYGSGFDLADVIKAVGSFRGVKRRFESVGRAGGVEVIEDYAHHPTELRSVISAAKKYSSGRIITVFQPHRYSRTRDMLEEFSRCFYDSDVLILTDIYSADEDAIHNVNTKNIYDMMDRTRFLRLELLDKNNIPAFVADTAENGDTVLVLGAGDIREVAGEIVSAIKGKQGR